MVHCSPMSYPPYEANSQSGMLLARVNVPILGIGNEPAFRFRVPTANPYQTRGAL